jgi:hypothetical protein
MRTTTLAKIKSCDPHPNFRDKLLLGFENTMGDDEPLPYSKILTSCGLGDALWATRTEFNDYLWVQNLALSFARHIEHYLSDSRSIRALDMADKFLRGEASRNDMHSACEEALEVYQLYALTVNYITAVAASHCVYYVTEVALSNSPIDVSTYIGYTADAAISAAAWPTEDSDGGVSEWEWQAKEFLRVVA